MAKLTGPDIQRLQQALLSAFNRRELEQLLLFRLNQQYDHIIPAGGTLPDDLLRVIQAAEAKGWTGDLLRAVAEARPHLRDLQSLVAQLLLQVEAPSPPSEVGTSSQELRSFEPPTVAVPAGCFTMGATPAEGLPNDETPQHELLLPEFHIGVFPVTNRQYREYLRREKQADPPKNAGWFLREPPTDRLDYPVIGVSWFDAVAYCQWLSTETGRRYRLPSEAEWEKAACWQPNERGGGQKRRFPWGDDFDPLRCNVLESGIGATTPFGHYGPRGASPYGCEDLLGNVQEWVSTAWGSRREQPDYGYPYQPDDGREDLRDAETNARLWRVHRGGSYREPAKDIRCTARGASAPDSRLAWRGFRVALDMS